MVSISKYITTKNIKHLYEDLIFTYDELIISIFRIWDVTKCYPIFVYHNLKNETVQYN